MEEVFETPTDVATSQTVFALMGVNLPSCFYLRLQLQPLLTQHKRLLECAGPCRCPGKSGKSNGEQGQGEQHPILAMLVQANLSGVCPSNFGSPHPHKALRCWKWMQNGANDTSSNPQVQGIMRHRGSLCHQTCAPALPAPNAGSNGDTECHDVWPQVGPWEEGAHHEFAYS